MYVIVLSLQQTKTKLKNIQSESCISTMSLSQALRTYSAAWRSYKYNFVILGLSAFFVYFIILDSKRRQSLFQCLKDNWVFVSCVLTDIVFVELKSTFVYFTLCFYSFVFTITRQLPNKLALIVAQCLNVGGSVRLSGSVIISVRENRKTWRSWGESSFSHTWNGS
jgi:hypothetical protein